MLAHVAIVLSVVPSAGTFLALVGTIVIFFIQKDKSKFVANHAKQAAIWILLLMLVGLVFGLVNMALIGALVATGGRFGAVGLAGVLSHIRWLVTLAFVAYGIFAGLQAHNGKEFTYAVVGKLANTLNL